LVGRRARRTTASSRSTRWIALSPPVARALGFCITPIAEVRTRAKTTEPRSRLAVSSPSFPIDTYTGRPTGRILPDNSAESRAYDAAGEVTTRTDFAGRTTTYAYDEAGRVLSRSYPDQSVVSFTYTPDGQRQTVTDARGTTTYGYDVRHRLVKLAYPDGRALTYGYDAHGNRTSMTATVGSQSLTTATAYDADNRPNRVTDALGRVTSLTYDATGNRVRLVSPNSTQTTYAYDARNRLLDEVTRTTDASPVTIQSYQYTLDPGGRRTQVTEADGTVRAYGYDSIDRLTSETVTGSLSYDKTFTYDGVGNRLTQATTGSGAATVSYGYDNRDRLTSENDTTYQYDANGNVTSKSGEATYTWDFENRLTQVAMNDGTLVTHIYDADGNRVQTTVRPSGAGVASATNLLVDASGALSQVVVDTDASGNIASYYTRVSDELLEAMRPASPAGTWTTRFVHGDGLGSVRALTDETGTAVDSRGYEAFGTKNVEAGSDPLVYGFAGEAFQSDSMLAYHRARWMDARLGRFEGMDPFEGLLQAPKTIHRYTYTSDEPTDRIDPSGNDDIDVDVDVGDLIAEQTNFFSVVGIGPSIPGQYANLRERGVGFVFGHLYIEYGDATHGRKIFEGLPDNAPSADFSKQYIAQAQLTGYAEPWGPPASDDDASSPLFGLEPDTYDLLNKAVALLNSRNIPYDGQSRGYDDAIPKYFGYNSNWWAVTVCAATGLHYASLPGWLITPGAYDSIW
jgi:RHS repeat-associated protein